MIWHGNPFLLAPVRMLAKVTFCPLVASWNYFHLFYRCYSSRNHDYYLQPDTLRVTCSSLLCSSISYTIRVSGRICPAISFTSFFLCRNQTTFAAARVKRRKLQAARVLQLESTTLTRCESYSPTWQGSNGKDTRVARSAPNGRRKLPTSCFCVII